MLGVPVSLSQGRVRPTLVCHELVTKQAHKSECDINNIVSKYDRTGVVSHISKVQGTYADVSHVRGYREALDAVRDAESDFYQLPSSVRARFNNDVAVFLDWAAQATVADIQEAFGNTPDGPLSPPAPEEATAVAPEPSEGS